MLGPKGTQASVPTCGILEAPGLDVGVQEEHPEIPGSPTVAGEERLGSTPGWLQAPLYRPFDLWRSQIVLVDPRISGIG